MVECRFIGYPGTQKGYKLWVDGVNKILVSRDVVFYEEQETNKNFANFQIEEHPEYPAEEEDTLAEEDHSSLEKTLPLERQKNFEEINQTQKTTHQI